MAFRKIRGLQSEEIFETKVTDGTGRLLSKWKVLKDDFPSVVKILNDKFDLDIRIIRRKKEEKDKDRDLEWLKWLIDIYKVILHVFFMKFKDLISVTENKNNKQVNLSVRKKQLTKMGISMEDLLNIKVKRKSVKLKCPQ